MSEVNLKVLGSRLIVKLEQVEKKTLGGIIIPGQEEQRSNRGTVITVGPGRRDSKGNLIPMEVSVGDVVIFGDMAGAPVSTEAEGEYLLLGEHEILAIVG